MTQEVLKVTDFPLHDLPKPIGLKREYCLSRRLTLDQIGGWLPLTQRSYSIWDEEGNLLLTCGNTDIILEDYKDIKDPKKGLVYTLDSPHALAYSYIFSDGKALSTCCDTPGPKRDMSVDFNIFGTKRTVQWRLILINDRDDGVLLADWKAVARFTQRGWFRYNRRIEIAKNVDYSLVVTALAALDLAGSSGYLFNPTKAQVCTPMDELWDQLEPDDEDIKIYDDNDDDDEEEDKVVDTKIGQDKAGMTATGPRGSVDADGGGEGSGKPWRRI
ncbi:hypothetical protein IAU59_002355 [Kwoniella sp. CBS 9459]